MPTCKPSSVRRGTPQSEQARSAAHRKLQTKMHELAEAVDAALDAEDEEKADALQEEGEAWASSCRRWKMACRTMRPT
jgi:ParB family chromosome partitioning protein